LSGGRENDFNGGTDAFAELADFSDLLSCFLRVLLDRLDENIPGEDGAAPPPVSSHTRRHVVAGVEGKHATSVSKMHDDIIEREVVAYDVDVFMTVIDVAR
jgi:hypothetical protein